MKRRRVDDTFASRYVAEERVKEIQHLYPASCKPRVVKANRVRAKGGGYRLFQVTVSASCPTTSHGLSGHRGRGRGRGQRHGCKISRDRSGRLTRSGCGKGKL